jgi:hypothetical protein
MFKGFSDSSRNNEFHGFPNLNFQMNNEVFGFSGAVMDFDAEHFTSTKINNANVVFWNDKINQIQFIQNTAAQQPLYVLNDSEFGNKPSLNFNLGTKNLISVPLKGFNTIAFAVKVDVAAVQDNAVNCLLKNSQFSNNGQVVSVNSGSTGVKGIGVYRGTNYATQDIESGVKDLNVHFSAISSNAISVDGVLSSTNNFSWINTFDMMGESSTGLIRDGIRGRVARIIFYNSNLSETQLVQLTQRMKDYYS